MRRFAVRMPLEVAYTREALLGVELIDAVTLERVTQGVEVTAKGLAGRPVLNHGGLFVWTNEDARRFDGLKIEAFAAPFESVELTAAQVTRPLHRVELHPRASYPFARGITALRGRLVESNSMPANVPRVAIGGATVRLEWLDDDGSTWRPWQAARVTAGTGDFTAIVRFAHALFQDGALPPRPPPDEPRLDAKGNLSVRLFATRADGTQRTNVNFYPVPLGRVTERTFAWDELQ